MPRTHCRRGVGGGGSSGGGRAVQTHEANTESHADPQGVSVVVEAGWHLWYGGLRIRRGADAPHRLYLGNCHLHQNAMVEAQPSVVAGGIVRSISRRRSRLPWWATKHIQRESRHLGVGNCHVLWELIGRNGPVTDDVVVVSVCTLPPVSHSKC